MSQKQRGPPLWVGLTRQKDTRGASRRPALPMPIRRTVSAMSVSQPRMGVCRRGHVRTEGNTEYRTTRGGGMAIFCLDCRHEAAEIARLTRRARTLREREEYLNESR